MIFINEWLPNPIGPDAAGEFVELYNSGNVAASLNGWVLKTENGKKFSLVGRSVPVRGYLLLKRSVTKLALRNTDGGLSLYGANGARADQANFLGTAPEGKSFSRVNYTAGAAQRFAFTDPTPGAVNKTVASVITVRHYPLNASLNHPLNSSGFLAIMMGTAALLLGLILYAIKTNEDLSELLFKRNKTVRRAIGDANP